VNPATVDDAGPASPQARRAALFAGHPPVLTARATGGTIRLRPPRPADIDAIMAACVEAEAVRWTTVPHPYARSDAEFFVGDYSAGRWARGEAAVFALADARDAYVGSMELRITARDPAVGDVGYLVAAPARGRGYAPAALRAMCGWGFEALGLARIEWWAYVGNDASRRAVEKAGFTVEGLCRSAMAHRGERRDAWFGALLPEDVADGGPDGGPDGGSDGVAEDVADGGERAG
jgi:RimJ/RimL family protein N-acetyltransferase